jgi:hypothetical protein
MKKYHLQKPPLDITAEPDTFEVAMFAYFGMSNKAITKSLRHLSNNQIQYRLKKAREKFGINVKRSDYRDGNNILSQRVIHEFKGFAQKKLVYRDLR